MQLLEEGQGPCTQAPPSSLAIWEALLRPGACQQRSPHAWEPAPGSHFPVKEPEVASPASASKDGRQGLWVCQLPCWQRLPGVPSPGSRGGEGLLPPSFYCVKVRITWSGQSHLFGCVHFRGLQHLPLHAAVTTSGLQNFPSSPTKSLSSLNTHSPSTAPPAALWGPSEKWGPTLFVRVHRSLPVVAGGKIPSFLKPKYNSLSV